MPIYDYRCEPCNHQEEWIRKVSERDDKHTCPLCGYTMKRMISKPSVANFPGAHGGRWMR